MEQTRPCLIVTIMILFLALSHPAHGESSVEAVSDGGTQTTTVVGRIYHLEGEVWRHVAEEDAWTAAVDDAPFGEGDIFYSDPSARAELIIPNNTWIRIDGRTRVEVSAAEDELTEVHLESGTARFYNKGSSALMKVTTPFGYIMAPEKTTFDLRINEDSVEIISYEGSVDFFHISAEERYEVLAGSPSLKAGLWKVAAGEGMGDPSWRDWNRHRDQLWNSQIHTDGDSVKYLPLPLRYEAHIFDDCGRWEKVYYTGAYHYFWRPVHVSFGWAPFTHGRWTVWYGDHTWIPYEPFGYTTHHYGNWVSVRGRWYWAPPAYGLKVRAGRSHAGMRLTWYPGRVAWVHSGIHVGWVPLAPYEPYYSHSRWGGRSVVINRTNFNHINLHKYQNRNHVVIVEKRRLYSVNNYQNIRVKNINKLKIVENFRVAPTINASVIQNHRNIKQKYEYTNTNAEFSSSPVSRGSLHAKRLIRRGLDQTRNETTLLNQQSRREIPIIQKGGTLNKKQRSKKIQSHQSERSGSEIKQIKRPTEKKATTRIKRKPASKAFNTAHTIQPRSLKEHPRTAKKNLSHKGKPETIKKTPSHVEGGKKLRNNAVAYNHLKPSEPRSGKSKIKNSSMTNSNQPRSTKGLKSTLTQQMAENPGLSTGQHLGRRIGKREIR